METLRYETYMTFNTSPALHKVPSGLDQLLDDFRRGLKEAPIAAELNVSLRSAYIDNNDPLTPTVSAYCIVDVDSDYPLDSEGVKMEIFTIMNEIEGIIEAPSIMRI